MNCICYDKTGTLTTDSLQLGLVHPVAQPSSSDVTKSAAAAASFTSPVPGDRCTVSTSGGGLGTEMAALLACCHGLTHVEGTLAGDPLELQTFAATGATLDEPHTDGGADLVAAQASTPSLTARARLSDGWTGHIVGTFEFQPALQRMGVLVEEVAGSGSAAKAQPTGSGRILSFVKGSPEAIQALCDPSTVPSDFTSTVESYTRRGFRVLAAGSKVYSGPLPLPGTNAASLRAQAESGLTLRGLIVLENPLKPQSAPTIAKLRSEASLPQFMVTGDHGQAAVAVARQCGLVDPGCRVFLADVVMVSPLPSAAGSASNGAAAVPAPPSIPSVVWRDVDAPSCTLDPFTLQPDDGSSSTPYKLAMTGRAFAVLLAQHRAAKAASAAGAGFVDGDAFPRTILNCAVFARMSPDQKAQLVEELQATGMYVLMIGESSFACY